MDCYNVNRTILIRFKWKGEKERNYICFATSTLHPSLPYPHTHREAIGIAPASWCFLCVFGGVFCMCLIIICMVFEG